MCMYCDNKKENTHFTCEVCGVGMCDECYDLLVEHDGHFHLILDNCDDEREIRLITEACGGEPDYICEDCVNRILTKDKK